MKLGSCLFFTMIACGLAACEPPAEQDEPEQLEPGTEATMERAPETAPVGVETSTQKAREIESTASDAAQETGDTGETAESDAEEPPPDQA